MQARRTAAGLCWKKMLVIFNKFLKSSKNHQILKISGAFLETGEKRGVC